MESTRDIRRLIEREIKKGSAPLTFDHIDYRLMRCMRYSRNRILSGCLYICFG